MYNNINSDEKLFMKIGIDGLLLTIPYPCGTRTYAEKLLINLAKIDKDNDYYIFVCKNLTSKFPKQRNFHLVYVPRILPIFKRQIIQPFIVQKYKVDIFHYLEPNGSIIHLHPKIITTVHDYSLGFTYPFFKDPLRRIIGHVLRFFTLIKTKKIIVDSYFIESEVKNNIHHHCIERIYLGVENNKPEVYAKKNVKGYFLALGDITPRKNVDILLTAYNKLTPDIKKNYPLKIAISSKYSSTIIRKLIKANKLENFSKLLEDISTTQLNNLYSNALCFIYPSLYEGFGLPILEAMVCGCPVITSNYGAMQEIAGDAALLVNPKSVKSISASMIQIIRYKRLRNKLIKRGLNRVKNFTWEKTAQETLKVYESSYKHE